MREYFSQTKLFYAPFTSFIQSTMNFAHIKCIGLALILFISCNSTEKKENIVDFNKEFFLEHTQYDTELFIKHGRIAVIDSFIILISNQQDPFCKLYSITQNMKEVGGYGRVGSGPNEFIQPLLTYSYDNTFGLNEINKKELAIMHLLIEKQNLSVIEKKRLKADTKKDEEQVFRTDYYFSRLDDEHYVSLLYDNNNKYFSLFDSTLTLISRFGESPINEKVSPSVAVNRLQGRIAACEGTMTFATSYLPYLACYQLRDTIMEKKWSFFYDRPHYGIRNGDLLFNKEKSYGQVINLKMDARFIYLLYLDQLLSEFNINQTEKSMSNLILVFDYEGNAIAKLHLSCRINEMALSNDGKKLYGIAHLPEPTIVDFNLSKIKEKFTHSIN
jgi:hypothetical protein